MQISSILSADRTKARVVGGSKKRLLENLAQTFADALPDADPTELFQNLINRERLGSTGIGKGIAIPHCRFATGGKTLCACFTLDEPVDFDAIDGKPIDLIFAMLVPEDAAASHLETLAELAQALQTDTFVKALRKSDSDMELFRVASGVN
ncbi:PTS IIA-like nitrogen regulatory protein PtsN [Teredinibacter waterburyi]|uniref:PTS IIA-like nitrogen regulatory protein PtsN n=1 Tax=Teredinibacter waterburyi TaxID=1500538 RepID=UPI00165FCAB2|nr:PTS IIA-like nitrogen regulatory protein PtsN [Teredinibacter waterburyi]